ncbi:MAG: serine/threonine protein kinase [Deltaproteobacteria bacterium]|nr:serine/threonine protein kinase [Deltaproteobacteria bacterium]
MLSGDVLQRFHVKRPLAKGGMGELWLADDEQHHDVVLKTVRDDLKDDDEVRRCFRREIAVTASVTHEHIVHHVAHGQVAGVEVLALEHITGASLAELLDRSALPLGAALCVAEDVARALAYLHSLKDVDGAALEVVHGDISPQNVVIDRFGQALLIDFGGATWRGADVTPGMLVGKPGYISPEQARGEPVDRRSDQFALGVVLWEMLVGRALFSNEDVRRDLPVPPLSQFVPVPYVIEAAVVRLLAHDREARFTSTEEAADVFAGAAWAHGVDDSRLWLAERAWQIAAELEALPAPVITSTSARTLR